MHIWCHAGLVETIKTLVNLTVQKKFARMLGERILLHGVADGETAQLLDHTVTFFTFIPPKPLSSVSPWKRTAKSLLVWGMNPIIPCARAM